MFGNTGLTNLTGSSMFGSKIQEEHTKLFGGDRNMTTKDIEGAQPRKYTKHIWGHFETNQTNSKIGYFPHQSTLKSPILGDSVPAMNRAIPNSSAMVFRNPTQTHTPRPDYAHLSRSSMEGASNKQQAAAASSHQSFAIPIQPSFVAPSQPQQQQQQSTASQPTQISSMKQPKTDFHLAERLRLYRVQPASQMKEQSIFALPVYKMDPREHAYSSPLKPMVNVVQNASQLAMIVDGSRLHYTPGSGSESMRNIAAKRSPDIYTAPAKDNQRHSASYSDLGQRENNPSPFTAQRNPVFAVNRNYGFDNVLFQDQDNYKKFSLKPPSNLPVIGGQAYQQEAPQRGLSSNQSQAAQADHQQQPQHQNFLQQQGQRQEDAAPSYEASQPQFNNVPQIQLQQQYEMPSSFQNDGDQQESHNDRLEKLQPVAQQFSRQGYEQQQEGNAPNKAPAQYDQTDQRQSHSQKPISRSDLYQVEQSSPVRRGLPPQAAEGRVEDNEIQPTKPVSRAGSVQDIQRRIRSVLSSRGQMVLDSMNKTGPMLRRMTSNGDYGTYLSYNKELNLNRPITNSAFEQSEKVLYQSKRDNFLKSQQQQQPRSSSAEGVPPRQIESGEKQSKRDKALRRGFNIVGNYIASSTPRGDVSGLRRYPKSNSQVDNLYGINNSMGEMQISGPLDAPAAGKSNKYAELNSNNRHFNKSLSGIPTHDVKFFGSKALKNLSNIKLY